jgi:hypothetical protein
MVSAALPRRSLTGSGRRLGEAESECGDVWRVGERPIGWTGGALVGDLEERFDVGRRGVGDCRGCGHGGIESSRMLWCDGLSSSASVAAQTGMRVLTSSLSGAEREYARVGVRPRPRGEPPGRALRARASADTRVRAWIWGVLSVADVRPRAAERLRTRRGFPLWSWIGARWPDRGSGGGETGYLLLRLGRLGLGGLGQDQRHRLDRQVAALHQPLVVLF